MLAVPTQVVVSTGQEQIDYHRCLRTLMSHLAPEKVPEVERDVASYLQLRQGALDAIKTGPTDLGLQAILRYNFHMNNLVPRLDGFRDQMDWSFAWGEAFSTSKREVKSNSMYFDWGSVMWSLGAQESLKGAKTTRDSDEGIRISCKHFQTAAGIFDFILTNVLPHLPPKCCITLSAPSLQLVKNLMLAQGQMCFYEKSIKDRKAGNMKPAIIAKLSAQASYFYEEANKFSMDVELGRIIDNSWKLHTEFQYRQLDACAEYWQAIASKEDAVTKGTGFGEEVARLAKAEQLLTNLIKFAKSSKLGKEIYQGSEALLNVVASAKATADNDNKTIYLETIPSITSLKAIDRIAMVKSSSLPEYYCTEKPLFPQAYPPEVHESVAAYREQLQNIITMNKGVDDELSSMARATLGSINQPHKLDWFKSGGAMPDTLWKRVSQLQAIGSPQADAGTASGPFGLIKGMLEDLKKTSDQSQSKFKHCEDAIVREEENDERYRERQPTWTGTPLNMLNRDIKMHLTRLKDAFASAKDRDKQLETLSATLFTDDQDDTLGPESFNFNVMMWPRNKIESIFLQRLPLTGEVDLLHLDDDDGAAQSLSSSSSSSSSAASSVSETAMALEQKLVELASLIDERGKGVKSMEKLLSDKKCMDTVIASLLQLHATKKGSIKSDAEGMVMSAVTPFKDQIEQTKTKQETLLQEVTALDATFDSKIESDPLVLHRSKVLGKIEGFLTSFFGAHSHVNAALAFYNTLNSQMSSIIQNNDDLCYAQVMKRQEFEEELVKAINASNQVEADRKFAEDLMNEAKQQQIQQQQQVQQRQIQQQPQGSYNYGGQPASHQLISPNGGPVGVMGTMIDGPPSNARVLQTQDAGHLPQDIPPHPTQFAHGGAPLSSYPAPSPMLQQQQLPPSNMQTQQQMQMRVEHEQYPSYNPQAVTQQQNYNQQPSQPWGGASAIESPGEDYKLLSDRNQGYYQQPSTNAHAFRSTPQPAPKPWGPPVPATSSVPTTSTALNVTTSLAQQRNPSTNNDNNVNSNNLTDITEKVNRLSEMGFSRDSVQQALLANNGDENAALNSLLAGDAVIVP